MPEFVFIKARIDDIGKPLKYIHGIYSVKMCKHCHMIFRQAYYIFKINFDRKNINLYEKNFEKYKKILVKADSDINTIIDAFCKYFAVLSYFFYSYKKNKINYYDSYYFQRLSDCITVYNGYTTGG